MNKNGKIPLTVEVESELRELLNLRAIRENRTRSAVMRRAFYMYLASPAEENDYSERSVHMAESIWETRLAIDARLREDAGGEDKP